MFASRDTLADGYTSPKDRRGSYYSSPPINSNGQFFEYRTSPSQSSSSHPGDKEEQKNEPRKSLIIFHKQILSFFIACTYFLVFGSSVVFLTAKICLYKFNFRHISIHRSILKNLTLRLLMPNIHETINDNIFITYYYKTKLITKYSFSL